MTSESNCVVNQPSFSRDVTSPSPPGLENSKAFSLAIAFLVNQLSQDSYADHLHTRSKLCYLLLICSLFEKKYKAIFPIHSSSDIWYYFVKYKANLDTMLTHYIFILIELCSYTKLRLLIKRIATSFVLALELHIFLCMGSSHFRLTLTLGV